MIKCIRLCLDCADICTATAAVTSRQTAYDANVTRPLLEACVVSCKICGDECERHAGHHEHCRVCEQACRRCEQACLAAPGRNEISDRRRSQNQLTPAREGHRVIRLPYIVGIPETCRPGSNHGNQTARTPIATSSTPTAWPNGFPYRQSFSEAAASVSAGRGRTTRGSDPRHLIFGGGGPGRHPPWQGTFRA